MISAEKQILRAKMRAAVRGIEGAILRSRKIRSHLWNAGPWEVARVVFGFWALSGEPDWIGEGLPAGKLVAFPRIENGELTFHSATEFNVGAFGVREPAGGVAAPPPDLVLVPGLAFDRTGARLGRGKGYYDRWLGVNPAVKALGICFGCQILERIPTEPHDARVAAILTEDGFIWP